MPSELSTDSTKTSTSSDSSTTTSKVHVKPITRLLSQNILNIVHSLFSQLFSISTPSALSLLHFFHFLFSSILVLTPFTPFTWVFVLLPAGLAFCFVFYFLFNLAPLHVIFYFFLLFKFFIWFLCILLSTVQPKKMRDLCHTYLFFVSCYFDLAMEPSLYVLNACTNIF